MELIVGTDSTWSLRVWICLQLASLEASEVVIDLSAADYKTNILKYSDAGLVPALINNDIVIHDSLAITEYINEVSSGSLYPKETKNRALARSLCAEMHSGFMNLRSHLPFTLKPITGDIVLSHDIKQELLRVETIFKSAHLPYMFETPGAVDAYYCILAFRLQSYGINLNGKAGEYQHSLLNWKQSEAAINQARKWEINN